jgi:hypothetical protein
MKKNALFICLVIFSIIFITGCSTHYSIIYETRLSKSENLSLTEDDFEFNFFPTYNGIVFEIKNNSDQTARLIWDKSYFIMPNGNSYKALNTDILKEDYEVVAKAEYVSTIPSNSKFKRFTTSSLNSAKMKYTTISEFNLRLNTSDISYTQIIKEEFILSNSYWTPTILIESAVTDTTASELLKPISDFINTNNNLGLGLMLEHNGIEKEYRFDFIITKAHFIRYKLNSSDELGNTTDKYYLEYTFFVEEKKWENVHKELD